MMVPMKRLLEKETIRRDNSSEESKISSVGGVSKDDEPDLKVSEKSSKKQKLAEGKSDEGKSSKSNMYLEETDKASSLSASGGLRGEQTILDATPMGLGSANRADEGTISSAAQPTGESGDTSKQQPPTGKRLTFPEKLMELLNKGDCGEALMWLPNGQAFALQPMRFMKEVLPKHFEGTKFESFTRKLNRWGFKRIAGDDAPEDTFAYSHSYFRRDYPELCRGMSGGKKAIPDLSHLVRYRHNPELQRAALGGGLGSIGLGGLQLPAAPLSGIGGLAGQATTLEQQLALQQQLNQQYQQASVLSAAAGAGANPAGASLQQLQQELEMRQLRLLLAQRQQQQQQSPDPTQQLLVQQQERQLLQNIQLEQLRTAGAANPAAAGGAAALLSPQFPSSSLLLGRGSGGAQESEADQQLRRTVALQQAQLEQLMRLGRGGGSSGGGGGLPGAPF